MRRFNFVLVFAFILFFPVNIISQFEKMTDDEMRKKAESMGINFDEYLKYQQLYQNKQVETEPKQRDFISVPQVQQQSSFNVAAFNGRGEAEKLSAFGYSTFSYSPTTFEPSANIPVPTNYVVGPGDEIIVTLWGETQLVHNLTVSKNGDIYIPNVGQVNVNGLSLNAVKNKLFGVLSKTYSSLTVSPTGGAKTSLDVTTGKLRSVKIYVLGEVNKPGGYTLPALSTSFTALYYSGGPTVNGTLRNVKVMRRGKTISEIDLYDYLITGDKSKDVRLEDEDVIFVSPAGKRVAILGNVFRPAIYELQKGESLKNLLRYAGGLNFNAYFDRVHIERIIPFEQRKQFVNNILNLDINFSNVNELNNSSYELADGDVVSILGVNTLPENRVSITGNVKKPGIYQLNQKGMTVRDLIIEADSLFPDAFLQKAILIRTLPNEKKELISFDLKKAMDGDFASNLKLQNRDEVRIFKEETFFPIKGVEINGAVKNPGLYTRFQEMTLTELIIMAGGLTDSATVDQIEITRLDTVSQSVFAQKYTVNLPKEYWKVEKYKDFVLQDYDRVLVKVDPQKTFTQTVTIEGEVYYPGKYSILYEGEKILNFIRRCNGLKPSAYPEGMYVRRKNTLFELYTYTQEKIFTDSIRYSTKLEAPIVNREFFKDYSNRIPVNWENIIEDSTSFCNFELMPGDVLVIPKNPKVVYVLGEVGLPSTIPYKKGANVSYYIKQAGGYTDNAAKGDEIVIQPNGEKWNPSGCFLIPDDEIKSGAVIISPFYIEDNKDSWPVIRDILSVLSTTAILILTIHNISK